MAYVIGVDCGTSGTKTVLFDEKGTVIASKTIEYPMYQPKNGYAEQWPGDWANAMINTVKAVMAQSGVSKDDVKGIGISGQMHGLVMLDKDNNVIRPSIIWCDQRTAKEVEWMNSNVGEKKLIEITANLPSPAGRLLRYFGSRTTNPRILRRSLISCCQRTFCVLC